MTNSTVPPQVVAEEGETAMGLVAEGFLGPAGLALIVAGAVFSMVSASNASILAATGIGSLMGRRGQAPRPLTRIHPTYGTPFWSVATVTATVVAMIVFFIMLFPAEDAPLGLDLGLTALTGFATLNLLLPLSVVNAALIVHRRKFPGIERGFRVPGVPVVPALGVLANIGLIYNLPVRGVATGVLFVAILVVAYVVWGGAPEIEELYRTVVPAEPTGTASASGEGPIATKPQTVENEPSSDEALRVLVAVARPDRAVGYVRLAATLARRDDMNPFVQVLTVTEIPDQTPYEMVTDTAEGRANRIEDQLADEDLDVDYSIESHVSRDVAFDIVQTARTDEADLVLMGYPEDHPEVTEAVEYRAPCSVVFAAGFGPADWAPIETVTVGAGGGPHHRGSLSVVQAVASQGADVHIVAVTPDRGGTAEDPGTTVDAFAGLDVDVREVEAPTVADGLIEATEDGILLIGASRDRRLRQWIFGSTPDRVVDRADEAGVPVLIYASASGVPQRIEDYFCPLYRYLRGRVSGG